MASCEGAIFVSGEPLLTIIFSLCIQHIIEYYTNSFTTSQIKPGRPNV